MKKVIVLGDICKDLTHTVKVNARPNPEDHTVPLYEIVSTQKYLGMSANVFSILCTALDKEGSCVDTRYLTSSTGAKITKSRFYDTENRYLFRIDKDVTQEPISIKELSSCIGDTRPLCVVSDYNKGAVSEELLQWLDLQLKEDKVSFVILDTKKTDLGFLKRTIVKVNTPEYHKLISYPDYLIKTDGPRPVKILRQGAGWYIKPVPPIIGDINVCGAGDAFTAGLAYFLVKATYSDSVTPDSFLAKAIEFSAKYITRGK